MARANLQTTDLREALECATGALVRAEYTHRITRLRVDQARQRSGLDDLLDPALTELDDIYRSVMAAKTQVSRALTRLTEK
jgi:hypothetical protein